MISSFLSRYQWFRRLVGGRWELWCIPVCRSLVWLQISKDEPDDRYQPCSSGPRIAREDWAKSLIPKPVRPEATRRQRLDARSELRRWIEQHMPDLDAELGPKSMDQVRVRLNEITGCTVQGGESVENGCAVFLAALKKMKETT